MELSLKKKRLYGPDVILIHRDGTALVEKTYRNKPFFVRMAGCILIRWETYIYSKLKDIDGIPKVIASNDPYTLATTFMGGHNLRSKDRIPDETFFGRLEELIKNLHKHGVVHLDMRNRRNYGMDNEGMPYLVDFATSIYTPFKGPVWRLLCRIDWMGYLKVKAKLNPGLMSHNEKRGYALGNALSRLWLPSKVIPFFRGLISRFFR